MERLESAADDEKKQEKSLKSIRSEKRVITRGVRYRHTDSVVAIRCEWKHET